MDIENRGKNRQDASEWRYSRSGTGSDGETDTTLGPGLHHVRLLLTFNSIHLIPIDQGAGKDHIELPTEPFESKGSRPNRSLRRNE